MSAILEEAKHIFINTGYIWKYFYYNDDNKTMKRLSILIIVLLILLLLILVILVAIDAESNYIEGFGYSALGCITLGILSILHALSYGIGSDYDVNHKKQSANQEYKQTPKRKIRYGYTRNNTPIYKNIPVYYIIDHNGRTYTSDKYVLDYHPNNISYIYEYVPSVTSVMSYDSAEYIPISNTEIEFYNEDNEDVGTYTIPEAFYK